MRVVILGSGVIGVTSAWYLAQQGHEVVIIDRQPGSALEASYANAGQISPGYSTPWAAPGIPLKALKWLFQRRAPLTIRPDGSLFQLQWLWQMLLNCNQKRYQINKERMLRLSEYALECLHQLRQQTGINYEQRQGGTLQLFRSMMQYKNAAKDVAILEKLSVPYQLLQTHQLSEFEPALDQVKHKFTGGLRLPTDETGNCYLFTCQLAEKAAQAGVTFRYQCTIDRLVAEGSLISGVQCGDELIQGDAYVMALGSYSRSMLTSWFDIPVYPVKGYSLTIPLQHAEGAPVSTVLDETYKIAITRLGQHIRVGGMAELMGFNTELNPSRRETLEWVVGDLFPWGGCNAKAVFWTGLRSMTPDSTPIIGHTRFNNLYLNTGHGTLGWTMACGAGQLLADLISGRTPGIPYADLSVDRYR